MTCGYQIVNKAVHPIINNLQLAGASFSGQTLANTGDSDRYFSSVTRFKLHIRFNIECCNCGSAIKYCISFIAFGNAMLA